MPETTPIEQLIPEPSLRWALGIALDAIQFAAMAGYPFESRLKKAIPFLQAEYLANGGFDGDQATGKGLHRCVHCDRVCCNHHMPGEIAEKIEESEELA